MSSNEWREVKLGETATIKGGKRLPKGKSLSKLKNSHPYIRVRDIGNSRLLNINDNFEYVDDDTQKTISRYIVNTNDILISIVGTIGLIAKVGETLNNANLTENCAKIINLKEVDSDYLYYFLISEKGQAEIKKATVGAVQAKLPLKNIQSIKMSLPALLEQRTIAATLSCLDDMIELNNRTNKILEEMAQAIFKRWFVDFEFPNEDGEPYKSSGGEMIDSELGEIPKGWRVVELGDVTTNIRERTKSNDYKVLSTVNTGDLKLSEEYFTKQVFSKDLSKYIIVRIKEFAYNPARVNIGSIGMNEYDFDGCVSPVYVVFKSEEDFHWFFKMFIKTKNFKSEVVKRASGSVRQSMNYSDFALIKIVYPPKGVIVKFNQFFETCYLAQREFTKEMEILSDIRDTLLPKLMSGEIRVPMEEVV